MVSSRRGFSAIAVATILTGRGEAVWARRRSAVHSAGEWTLGPLPVPGCGVSGRLHRGPGRGCRRVRRRGGRRRESAGTRDSFPSTGGSLDGLQHTGCLIMTPRHGARVVSRRQRAGPAERCSQRAWGGRPGGPGAGTPAPTSRRARSPGCAPGSRPPAQPSDQAPSPQSCPVSWEELVERVEAELDRLVLGDVLATVRPLRGHALETTWRQRTWEAFRALQAYARAKARQRAGRRGLTPGRRQRAAGTVTAATGRFSGLSAPVGAVGQEQFGLEPVRALRTLPGRAARPSPATSPPCGRGTASPPAGETSVVPVCPRTRPVPRSSPAPSTTPPPRTAPHGEPGPRVQEGTAARYPRRPSTAGSGSPQRPCGPVGRPGLGHTSAGASSSSPARRRRCSGRRRRGPRSTMRAGAGAALPSRTLRRSSRERDCAVTGGGVSRVGAGAAPRETMKEGPLGEHRCRAGRPWRVRRRGEGGAWAGSRAAAERHRRRASRAAAKTQSAGGRPSPGTPGTSAGRAPPSSSSTSGRIAWCLRRHLSGCPSPTVPAPACCGRSQTWVNSDLLTASFARRHAVTSRRTGPSTDGQTAHRGDTTDT